MRITNKTLFFGGIILFMTHTSTEKTQFLNQCFFMAFIESKNYKENLDKYIDTNDSEYKFRLKDFIEHQKKTKETLELVPIDSLVEKESSPKTIDEIEAEYNRSHCKGGYTRLFLEYLFDERFKTEFNKLAKEKTGCENLENNNYFTTRADKGLFDYDLVGKYFESIKSNFKGDVTGWKWKKEDFEFTEKKLVRSKKSEKASKKNPNSLTVEKLDNVYSAFKIFGQGKYSRILIALLKQNGANKHIKLPENLMTEAISYILDDEVPVFIKINKSENKFKNETIKQNVSHSTSDSKKGIVYKRINDLQINKTIELLQRFFEDYKPSHLDRVYTEKSSEMISGNVTLRGLLICEFKNIAKKQWNIYKALEAKNLEDSYETVSMKMNYYTNKECKKIQDKYESLFLNKTDIPDYCSTEEMLEYILKNEPTVIQDKTWKCIINKYAGGEYFKEESSDEMNDAEIQKIINTCFSGYSERLFNLFKRYFVNIPDFIEVVAKQIQDFSNTDFANMEGVPKIVLANAIRSIATTIEKKEIYKCIKDEKFLYSSLNTSPFNFYPKRIEKVKLLFLLENWRYHPEHPWQSFWKKYPRKYKSSINYESFKSVMNGIYQQFNEVVL